jgi:hypothetical protein
MAGLDPAIHVSAQPANSRIASLLGTMAIGANRRFASARRRQQIDVAEVVDGRVKPGHDGVGEVRLSSPQGVPWAKMSIAAKPAASSRARSGR